jgi:hypothetical protein
MRVTKTAATRIGGGSGAGVPVETRGREKTADETLPWRPKTHRRRGDALRKGWLFGSRAGSIAYQVLRHAVTLVPSRPVVPKPRRSADEWRRLGIR